jgi:hypothetical protein
MARKDFDDYYNKVCKQFHSLKVVFDDLSKEVAEGMVEPERQKQLEATIEPIKNSYQTLSYIKYLLDKPNRKEKEARYKRMNKKLLEISEGHTQQEVLKQNQYILDNIKN